MTKDELSELVEFTNGAFNRDAQPFAVKSQKKAWWEFLNDLAYTDCLAVVKRAAVVDRYMPRPGDIRRQVLVGTLPDPIEAWEELRKVSTRVANGEDAVPVHPLTKETMKRLGQQAMGFYTNGDRDAFVRLYERVRDDYTAGLCGV